MNKVRVPVFPIIYDEAGTKKIIEQLHKAKVDSVFLCTLWALHNKKMYNEHMAAIEKAIPVFKAEGFEVMVWLGSTIGHSAPLAGGIGQAGSFMPWTSVDGTVCEGCFCPTDKTFANALCNWVKEVAEFGPDGIILDDDYRMSDRGDAQGCLCDNHLKIFNDLVGENFNRKEVVDHVFTGPKNKYRDAYMKMHGDTLRDLAKQMRAIVDSVDENIRLGYCCPPAGFNVDGTNAIELSHIFAGKTKPVLRLGGAPYWGKMDPTMISYATETERLIQTWCDGEGIESFSELDSYPRPRFSIPASFMEASDTILMADGRLTGSLKYMADYSASPDYETGYFDAHCKNMPVYEKIQKMFDGKKATGLSIFECHDYLTDMTWPDTFPGINQRFGSQILPPTSVRWMRNLSLPLTYNDTSIANVVFGENAQFVTPEMRKNGMILNMRSARILSDKGIDVGYTEAKYAGVAVKERYIEENELINIMDGIGIYELKHKDGVKVLTEFLVDDKFVPGAYEYENADGERYLVFPFWEYNCEDPKTSLEGFANKPHWYGKFAAHSEDTWFAMMRNYARTRQMIKSIEWLNRRPMDVACPGYPYLYLLAKKDDNALSVGLWNLGLDDVAEPVLTLGEEYSSVECVNCEAVLEGKQLKFKSTLYPIKFAFVELKK